VELVALDDLVALLVGREVALYLLSVDVELAIGALFQLHRAAVVVFLLAPARAEAMEERTAGAGDDMPHRHDAGMAEKNATDLSERVPLGQLFDLGWNPAVTLESVVEFRSLAHGHDELV